LTFRRRTLSNSVVFEGLGLHSGVPVRATVHPSSSGIVFRYGAAIIAALPENVTETRRCTRLGSVSTVEHLMSAFAGLEITDAEVELSAPELPAMDGSSAEFVNGLSSAGLADLGETELPNLFTRVFVQEEAYKIAVSAGEGHWRYDFQTPFLSQHFETSDVVAAYSSEIAPARTFGFERELPKLKEAGLAQGLDLSKALVIGEEGYVNEARFQDEPARHKLLDTIGDLYLAGIPIRFLNVVADRSGHAGNVRTAMQLRNAVYGQS
jgi:UDP-3-O-[3-hydroxymyristoyl] N-acetylglucosamine deacetylase